MATSVSVISTGKLYPGDGSEVELQVLDLTYETSRYNEAGVIELEALAHATPEEIDTFLPGETTLAVGINGRRVGAGVVNDISVNGEGVVELTAVDAVRGLYANTVGEKFDNDDVEVVLDRIFERAGLEEVDDRDGWLRGRPGYYIRVGSPSVPDVPGYIPGGPGQDTTQLYKVDKNFNDTPCAEALDEIVEQFNWVWFVNRHNVLHVTAFPDTEIHEPYYILETSAGKQAPPYQRVVVRGGKNTQDVPESEEGSQSGRNDRRHLLTRAPVQATAGEGEPTFYHTDKSLKTQSEAARAAQGIMNELRLQQASGEIETIGMPAARPYDVVYMPDDMGGEGYTVSSVTHKVNSDDGFITTIGCGGLLDTGES